MKPADHVAWETLEDGSLLVCHLPTGAMLELSAPAGQLWSGLLDGSEDATSEHAQAFVAVLAERDLLSR